MEEGLALPRNFPETVPMELKEAIIKRLDAAIAELVAIKRALTEDAGLSTVAVDKRTQTIVASKVEAGICLYCDTPLADGSTTRPTRGVHNRCYKRIVNNSEKTLDEHVSLGLLLPGKPGGRPSSFVDKASTLLGSKEIDSTLNEFKKPLIEKRSSKKKP